MISVFMPEWSKWGQAPAASSRRRKAPSIPWIPSLPHFQKNACFYRVFSVVGRHVGGSSRLRVTLSVGQTAKDIDALNGALAM